MFSRKIFGERLKQLRIEKKARQFNLAELLNVTRTQISDIENGKTTTTIEKLWLLADYFAADCRLNRHFKQLAGDIILEFFGDFAPSGISLFGMNDK